VPFSDNSPLKTENFSKMFVTIFKSKIHRVKVTQAELNYVGSITIDEALMEAAGTKKMNKYTSSITTTESALSRMSLKVSAIRALFA
jgi:hypothetical protein